MMIDALMKARIADHNSINPRINAMMLMIEVSMPSARDSPSTKLLPAWLNRLNKPAEAINDKADDRTECLAEPFEKTFYLHVVNVLM